MSQQRFTTSREAYHRIRWAPRLDPSEFVIGYDAHAEAQAPFVLGSTELFAHSQATLAFCDGQAIGGGCPLSATPAQEEIASADTILRYGRRRARG